MLEWAVRWVESTGSTNADVAEAARGGAAEGIVVVTSHQHAGRGRLDRSWVAPPGTALAVSFLLRPDVPPVRWPWLPLLAGVAFADAIRDLPGPDGRSARAVLKWPNDLLVDGRKLAGILVERVETSLGPAAVVGVGVNVLQTAQQLLPGATSLAVASEVAPGCGPELEVVLAVLADELAERYTEWVAAAGAPSAGLREAYRARCDTLDRDVRVELPGGEVLFGRAVNVDDFGRLVVATADGQVAVSAGDIVHVRSV